MVTYRFMVMLSSVKEIVTEVLFLDKDEKLWPPVPAWAQRSNAQVNKPMISYAGVVAYTDTVHHTFDV